MKKTKIKKIFINNEILKVLSRCRLLDMRMGIKYLEITEEEIDGLVELELITKEFVQSEKFKVIMYCEMTEKGEQYVKENLTEIDEIYRGFIFEHDLELSKVYLELTKEERDTWMTRDDMIKKYKFQGTIDGAFVNLSGEIEGVEILSGSAKSSAIGRAEAFLKHAEIANMRYILY